MKNTIIVKNHPSVQLAHLYEHLFVQRVNEFLYEKGVFRLLDYSLSGTTYEEGGIIVVDYGAYTKRAARYCNDIAKLSIEFGSDKDNVSKALLQIIAEESHTLRVKDIDMVIRELEGLNNSPWINIDSLVYINTRSIRAKNHPIYLTNEKAKKPQISKVSISLDKDFSNNNQELIPLFVVLSRAFLSNIAPHFSKTFATYPGEIYINNRGSTVLHEFHTAQNPYCVDFNATDLRHVAREVINNIVTSNLQRRICDDLTHVSYFNNPESAPGYEHMITGTKILTGSEGWKRIATPRNVDLILTHSSIIFNSRRISVGEPFLRKSADEE